MQSLAIATGAHPIEPSAFRNLPPSRGPRPAAQDVLRGLQPIAVVTPCETGHAIFREGDPATHWYQVATGALRSCKLLADGRRQIGEFLLPGDVFGFEVGDAHTLDVEALGHASVTRFSRGRIRLLLDTRPDLAARLPQLAFETTARAHARLLVLARQTAQERVVGFVLEMARRLAVGGSDFVLPMNRNDIADYLCLTIETVCRVIADLKRDGLIQATSAQHIAILDRAALERLAVA